MINDMNVLEINAASREVLLKLYPSGERRVLVSDREVPYPDGKLIVSRTDRLGIITHCNPAFVEMSGYSQHDLIGVPHNIPRHPDMPAIAFKGLCQEFAQGLGVLLGLRNRDCQHPRRRNRRLYIRAAQAVAQARGGVGRALP